MVANSVSRKIQYAQQIVSEPDAKSDLEPLCNELLSLNGKIQTKGYGLSSTQLLTNKKFVPDLIQDPIIYIPIIESHTSSCGGRVLIEKGPKND